MKWTRVKQDSVKSSKFSQLITTQLHLLEKVQSTEGGDDNNASEHNNESHLQMPQTNSADPTNEGSENGPQNKNQGCKFL